MIKNANYILSFLLMLFIQLTAQPLVAQQNKQMFMFQIDGNNYIRKTFDKKRNLKNYQIFKAGKIVIEKGKYLMPLTIYSFDNNSKLEDSSKTYYTCKPSENLVLMNVFPFAKLSSNKTIKVKATKEIDFYPLVWEENKKLSDIYFSLSIEGGLIGAIASGSKIKIYQREITKANKTTDTYSISSKVQIKAIAFGINIKTIYFTVEEVISPKLGILEQKFTEDTGEYFTITLQK